jgi:hypothetical protein
VLREASETGREPDGDVVEAMQQAMWNLVEEMTEAIFTPERKARLAEDVRAYRDHLQEVGQQDALPPLKMVLSTLAYDEPSHHNPFLTALSYVSLHAILKSSGEEME